MARLSDVSRTLLELQPVAYEHEDITPPPDAGRILAHGKGSRGADWKIVRHTPSDDYANWLLVRMAASDGVRSWSATRADFLIWELHRLVRWLQAIAANEPDTDPWWICTDDPIDIRAERTPAGIHLTLTLGDWTWPEGQAHLVTGGLGLPDDDDLSREDFDEEGYPLVHFAPDLGEDDREAIRYRVRMMFRPVERFRHAAAQDASPTADADPRPPDVLAPQVMEFPILHLAVSPDMLLNFVDDLEAELRPFPVRVVESNGDATRQLQG